MKIVLVQKRISELMARFVFEVKAATAQGDTYTNFLAETVLVRLLREVYGFGALRNLNHTERQNFPAIDLADDEARVAIQVTSTPDSAKIKDTLKKFVAHQLHLKYDRLIVYILTEKQQSYSGKGFEKFHNNLIEFDIERDILDYKNILQTVNKFDLPHANRVQQILEEHFRDDVKSFGFTVPQHQTEKVFLNLLEVLFPRKLYIGSIDIDRDAVIKVSSREGRRIRLFHNSSQRDIVRAYLEQEELRFGVDWHCYEKKILTFHDLSDEALPLSHVVDPGTVEAFTPEEFYGINEDYERVFKALLWRTLQQMLFRRGVHWQKDERLFIFQPLDGQDTRIEKWQEKKKDERTVYKRVPKKDNPDESLRHEHFGFRTQFKQFGNQWYIVIKPDWYASYDGYRKDTFGNFVEYKKREENNLHVATHARFIANFLKNDPNYSSPDLFNKKHIVPFMQFGEYISLVAPALHDEAFLTKKGRKHKTGQLPLPEK